MSYDDYDPFLDLYEDHELEKAKRDFIDDCDIFLKASSDDHEEVINAADYAYLQQLDKKARKVVIHANYQRLGGDFFKYMSDCKKAWEKTNGKAS